MGTRVSRSQEGPRRVESDLEGRRLALLALQAFARHKLWPPGTGPESYVWTLEGMTLGKHAMQTGEEGHCLQEALNKMATKGALDGVEIGASFTVAQQECLAGEGLT